MRALTSEEAAHLSGRDRGTRDAPTPDPLLEVSERLRARGCVRREVAADGYITYYVTDLGRLALRVAVAHPSVSL